MFSKYEAEDFKKRMKNKKSGKQSVQASGDPVFDNILRGLNFNLMEKTIYTEAKPSKELGVIPQGFYEIVPPKPVPIIVRPKQSNRIGFNPFAILSHVNEKYDILWILFLLGLFGLGLLIGSLMAPSSIEIIVQ